MQELPTDRLRGFRRDLLTYWEKHCEIRGADDSLPVPGDDLKHAAPLCQKCRTCVCSGVGAEAWHFHANMTSLLKPFLVVKRNKKGETRAKKERTPPARSLLEQGMLVLELTPSTSGFSPAPCAQLRYSGIFAHVGWGVVAAVDCEAEQEQAVLQDAGGASAAGPPGPRWFHISFCNFRTWTFALLELEKAAEQPFPDKIVLRVPDEPQFRTGYRCFKECIDFNWPWKCNLHVIWQDNEPLIRQDRAPEIVEVCAFGAVPEFRLWKASSD